MNVTSERRARRRLRRGLAADLTPPPPASFGRFGRSVIVPPARVESPECIFIGDGVLIHEHAWLNVARAGADLPRLEIGDGTLIGRWCSIACGGSMVIGADVVVGDQVFLGDTYHRYEDPDIPCIRQPLGTPRPVVIGDGAMLGTGAIVILGVTVGRGAIVDGGAVVTKDVADGARVRGNPAEPVP
jgi:carbonic anhydrase/acetyltransferase-like protein (isoleucine patch superfamily)